MSIDLEPRDGHWQFRIGPVERWVVGIGASALIGGAIMLGTSVLSRLDELTKGQAEQSKQQAVTSQQIATLNALLANVPALSERVSRSEARIDALERQQERSK